MQTSNAAPVLASPEAARFEIFGEVAGSVRLPSGTTMSFPAGGGFSRFFASRAAVDTAFPAGACTMALGTVTGIVLTMPASPCPTEIPPVLNGTRNAAGRLVIDPTQDYTITPDSFTGYNPPRARPARRRSSPAPRRARRTTIGAAQTSSSTPTPPSVRSRSADPRRRMP